MKCISLWQPWASLIASGSKRVETRHWRTNYRGPIAIHAAKRGPREMELEVLTCAGWNEGRAYEFLRGCPLGAVVAVGRLVACLPTPKVEPEMDTTFAVFDSRRLPEADPMVYEITPMERNWGDYSPGRFCWVLEGVNSLAVPIPFRGSQGLFEVPDEILLSPAPTQQGGE